TITIGNNDLTGDFPRNVCRIRTLETVSVDCDAQGCECCTECADELVQEPSLSPVAAPTDPPTAAAIQTVAPTQCVNAVESVSGCYAPDDPINLRFTNCDPENDDWVGIYDAGEDFDGLPNPPVWSWACGTRNCREAVSSDTFALDEVHASNGAWPLDEGSYVVIMARNSAQPYTAYAVSSTFVIDEGCRR
ncbi:MAG: hypothetical protein SGILL_009463, partial [Bacillariaceae sp.]